MNIQPPINFDSLPLDFILNAWLEELQVQGVEAVVILGPQVTGTASDRTVFAVHPPRFVFAAKALAKSADFGPTGLLSEAPAVQWELIEQAQASADPARWRWLWSAYGFLSLVRVEFTLPGHRAFECFLMSKDATKMEARCAMAVWSTLSIWPKIRRSIGQARSPLTERETECLRLALEGLTARETADKLDCGERTVTYFINNAMSKFSATNKLAAIQRAIWLGVI